MRKFNKMWSYLEHLRWDLKQSAEAAFVDGLDE